MLFEEAFVTVVGGLRAEWPFDRLLNPLAELVAGSHRRQLDKLPAVSRRDQFVELRLGLASPSVLPASDQCSTLPQSVKRQRESLGRSTFAALGLASYG